jgi:hypothetical protein
MGSSIGNADNTPIIAKHPAMTKIAIFGARIIFVALGCVVSRIVTATRNRALNGAPAHAPAGRVIVANVNNAVMRCVKCASSSG